MIFQTVKSTGIAILLGAGVLATMAVAQKGKTPAADPAAQPAGASLLLAPNKRPPDPQPRTQPNPGDLQRKTQAIMQALEEPIVMPFPKKTPLDDVLKYIEVATTTPAFSGIPIYVEPLGLQEANKSLNSTIEFDRADLPLKTSLRLILKPLGLSYIVKDGFLMIDSRSAITETRVEEVERKLDRVLEALERLERAK